MVNEIKSKPVLVPIQPVSLELTPILDVDEIKKATQELSLISEPVDHAWYSGILAYRLSLGAQWQKAEEVAMAIESEFAFEKAEALVKISKELIEVGLTKRAYDNLKIALTIATANEMPYNFLKAEALNMIASLLNKIEEKDLAITVWQQAIEAGVGSQAKEGTDGARRLRGIAMELAMADLPLLAEHVISLITIDGVKASTQSEVEKLRL
jgi:hypothetical protein